MAKPTLQDYELLKAVFGPALSDENYEVLFLRDLVETDRVQFTNRYRWYNLPEGLDGELIERILYYRGQGAFFYSEATDRFYFLPYCLEGSNEGSSIDCYGRYNYITPLQFNGSDYDLVDGKKGKDANIPFIPGMRKKVLKTISDQEPTAEDMLDGAVILHDRGLDNTQITIPRRDLNLPYLRLMAECPCFARTSLIANSGITGMEVMSGDEASNVDAANKSVASHAKQGKIFIPIRGTQEFKDLPTQGKSDPDMAFRAYESIDNMRLGAMGLQNGGVFDKQSEYVNETQAGMSGNNVGLLYDDGLKQRQEMADIVNYYFGTSIYVDSSEAVTNSDQNMDGRIEDDQDQSGIQGEQPNV